MSKRTHDLAVKTGTYQKGGETKNRYENIGSVFQDDNGGEFMTLKRTFNPAGVPNPDNKDSIIISKFAVKETASEPEPQAQAPDGEIPF